MRSKLLKKLHKNLALLLCGAMLFSLIGAVSSEAVTDTGVGTISPGDVSKGDAGETGGEENGIPEGPYVTLRALDLTAGQSKISDTNREMPQEYLKDTYVPLGDDGKLPADLDKYAPKIPGWTFQCWYTAPVRYAFWGGKTTSGQAAEALPFAQDCDGVAYDFTEDTETYPGASHTLTKYWLWLTTLEQAGEKATPGETAVTSGETADGSAVTLYALYQPTTIKYELCYNGWGRTTSVLSCGRQYGTPFGETNKEGWDGYVFDGWYPENGGDRLGFYSIPQDGARYVAHWHSATDEKVNWETYKEYGYRAVTGLTMKDGNVGGGKVLGDTLPLYACAKNSQTIQVAVNPADSGVSKLNWEVTGDTDAVRLEIQDGGLKAIVSATGKAGKATIKVSSANGCSDSVTVDTAGHAFGKSEVVRWGNCATPTRIRDTCVYCGKVALRDTYSDHKYAYREIPATCTDPQKWICYCTVCGKLNPDGDMVRGQALGHNFQTFNAVGCSGTTTTKVCQTCGYTEVSSDPSATSHNWSDTYTVDKRPTCSVEGSKSLKCRNCGATKQGSSVVVPADPSLHLWEPWTIETEAGETTAGEQTRTCSVCGMKETRAIPPTSYTVDDSAIIGSVNIGGSDQVANQTEADKAIQKTVDQLLSNGSMLGDDIRYAAAIQQQEISTEILVTSVATPENTADAEQFLSILGNNANVLYMDIDIFVKAGSENIGRITETVETMTFSAKIPAGGRIVRVLRAHEGVVETIASWVEGDTVYFTTDKFSTFAVSASNDISLADAEAIPDQTYTGSEIKPAVILTINGTQALTEGVDYSLSYRNNVETGTASITITGMGSFAGSSKNVTFKIVRSGSGNTGSTSSGSSGNRPETAWNSKVDVDWNAVISALDAAEKGSNVNVSTGTEFVIPASVQKRVLKDKVTLACQVTGTDITITLSSSDIKKPKKDVSLSISNQAAIPTSVSSKVTDTAVFSRVLNIGQKVLFSQKMDVHMVLGARYAGKLAVMYSYDESTDSMRYESSFQITKDGRAMFPLQRGDEYVIVVADSVVKETMGTKGNYRVVPGDTLSRIAARNGISLSTLLRANPQVKNINRIHVGEALEIPSR